MPRSLPPLTALRAFEAAARLSSFTKAARELHVTPAAVSPAIAAFRAWFIQEAALFAPKLFAAAGIASTGTARAGGKSAS